MWKAWKPDQGRLTPLTTHANDASSDQLLDFGTNARVLHVLLQSGRIALCLLQDGLHDWVAHDTHDLRGNPVSTCVPKWEE